MVAAAGDPKPNPWLGFVLEGTGRALLTGGATLALDEKEKPAGEEPKAGRDEGSLSVFSGLAAGDIGS